MTSRYERAWSPVSVLWSDLSHTHGWQAAEGPMLSLRPWHLWDVTLPLKSRCGGDHVLTDRAVSFASPPPGGSEIATSISRSGREIQRLRLVPQE